MYKVIVFSRVSLICIKLGTDCFLEPLKEMSFLHSPENRDENQFPLSWLPKGFGALKQNPPSPCKHSLPHWTQCVDLCKKGSSSFLFVIFILLGGFAFQSDFYIWMVQLVSSRRPSKVDRSCLALVLCVCLFLFVCKLCLFICARSIQFKF